MLVMNNATLEKSRSRYDWKKLCVQFMKSSKINTSNNQLKLNFGINVIKRFSKNIIP
jgi:hypothetical protein